MGQKRFYVTTEQLKIFRLESSDFRKIIGTYLSSFRNISLIVTAIKQAMKQVMK